MSRAVNTLEIIVATYNLYILFICNLLSTFVIFTTIEPFALNVILILIRYILYILYWNDNISK